MFDSECQKVNIGELLWSENSRAVNQAFVEKGYVIRPEDVIGSIYKVSKEIECIGCAYRRSESHLHDNSEKSILSQRTGSPPLGIVLPPPGVRAVKMNVLILE